VATVGGHYGSLTVNANGSYTYVPDAASINALPEGHYSDSFTVQVADAHGAVTTATYTVDLTGANDAPTLCDLNIGSLTDTAATDTFSNLTGQLSGHDADTGETATLTYAVLNADHHATTTVAGHYGSLTVNSDGSYSYVPNAAAINALPEGSDTDIFTVQTTDAHGATGTATLTVDVTGANDAPVINVDQISVTQNSDERVIVHGLSVADADAAADETFTIAATTADSGSNVSPASGSGSLADINSTLQTVTYREGSGEPSTDKVTLTVTDGHGATDTVNLIFNLAESSDDHVSLAGTTGKDVFFGTGYQDQFVFAANSNHDTILNFTPNQDHINLTAVVATDIDAAWIAQHVAASPTNSADTLITIDTADTIVLKGVNANNLHASDFIVHS
jgi:VCBS repeat-containing protein